MEGELGLGARWTALSHPTTVYPSDFCHTNSVFFFSQCHAPEFDRKCGLIGTCSLHAIIVPLACCYCSIAAFPVSGTPFSFLALVLRFSFFESHPPLLRFRRLLHSSIMRFFMPAYHIVAPHLHNRTCSSFPHDDHIYTTRLSGCSCVARNPRHTSPH